MSFSNLLNYRLSDNDVVVVSVNGVKTTTTLGKVKMSYYGQPVDLNATVDREGLIEQLKKRVTELTKQSEQDQALIEKLRSDGRKFFQWDGY